MSEITTTDVLENKENEETINETTETMGNTTENSDIDVNTSGIVSTDNPVEFTEEKESEGTGEEMTPIEAKLEENLLSEDNEELTTAQKKQLHEMLSNLAVQINSLGQIWMDTQHTYRLKDIHLKALLTFNAEHVTLKPDNLTEEENSNWDYMNGILKITEEDVNKIFPEKDHPIYAVSFDITKDRIHDAMQEFFMWSQAKREYEQINNAYTMLIERDESNMIKKAIEQMEAETDLVKKEQMQKEIDMYYYIKYLKFLRDDIDPACFDAIIHALADSNRANYYINRAREKMQIINVAQTFIPEIVKFEKLNMNEKYWANQGVLLMWFVINLSRLKVMKANNKRNIEFDKIYVFATTLDRIVRGVIHDETEKNEIIASLEAFEDKFINKVPTKKEVPHETTPPITDGTI